MYNQGYLFDKSVLTINSSIMLLLLLLLFAAPIGQIIFSIKRMKSHTNICLALIAFISLISGFILSFTVAAYAIYRVPPGTKCITGEVAIFFAGAMITTFFVPVIALVFSIIYYYRHPITSLNLPHHNID